MNNSLTKPIQTWFQEHDGDGEFTFDIRSLPYSVIGASGKARCVIYTTKPLLVSPIIHESQVCKDFGMIGRYGLAHETDIRWIRKVIGRQTLLFLGDMDPVDLMVFAWLRGFFPAGQVKHLGINDEFFKAIKVISTKSLSIPCTPSEQKSLPLLKKVFPDIYETIGNKCVRMLERGRKIELDIIVDKGKKTTAALQLLLPLTLAEKGNSA